MKKMFAGFAMLLLSIGLVAAEELNGKITKVVATDETKEITVVIDGKEKVIPIDKTATFHRKGKGTKEPEIAEGLKGIKPGKDGVEATIFVDMRDGKEVVTKIVLSGGKKK